MPILGYKTTHPVQMFRPGGCNGMQNYVIWTVESQMLL